MKGGEETLQIKCDGGISSISKETIWESRNRLFNEAYGKQDEVTKLKINKMVEDKLYCWAVDNCFPDPLHENVYDDHRVVGKQLSRRARLLIASKLT